MKIITIESTEDSRLDVFRGVRDRSLKQEGLMIVEGRHCVERSIAAGFDVVSVLCENERHGGAAALHDDVTVFSAGRDVIERVSGYGFHRGIMAVARRPKKLAVDDFLASVPADGPLGMVCVDRCASGENLGSIIRSAHAFGYHGVLASASADPFSRRVIRVSAGSVFSVPVLEVDDMGAVLAALKRDASCCVYAAVTDHGSTPFESCRVPPRRAVLFGSEGSGLSASLADLCDEAVHVPMRGEIDSLNLAVAAGIILQRFGTTGR